MQPAIPVVTTILAVLLKFEGSSPFKFLGVALAAAGAVVIVVLGDMGLKGSNKALLTQGVIAFVIEAFAYSSFVLIQRFFCFLIIL